MKNILNLKNVLLLFLASSLFYACDESKKDDSNKVAMFMNSNEHSGLYNSSPILKAPKTLWKVKTTGQVISSPVIIDNVVYVGSCDHNLYAINAVTGAIKWKYKTEGSINSTPLIANGKVLFLSYDGFFYALHKSDGKLAWKFETEGESVFNVKDYFNGSFEPDFWDFYLSSAIEKDGLIYFGSSDTNVYALNSTSGKKVWSYKTGASVHSSPALFENTLVIGSWDSTIYGLDANTGKENWSYTTGKDIEQYIWLGIQASPSIENGIAYIGSRDAKFYALNIRTGDTLWTNNKFDKSWMPSSAAIYKDNIYTGSSDTFSFFSINKETGKINYTTNTKSYTFSSPAIDGVMAYIGSTNGRLYGIELNSGSIKWEFKTEGSKTDTLKVFDANGEIDIKKRKELSSGISDMPTLSSLYSDIFINVGAILSSPVISNQVIYFGSSDGYIYAITDKNE